MNPNLSQLIQEFHKTLEPRNKNASLFGYHCIFTPEELLHAAGFVPYRIFPHTPAQEHTENCFHERSCAFAQNLLKNFYDGHFNHLKGVLFTQCCDALRVVYELVSIRFPHIFYINTPALSSCGQCKNIKKVRNHELAFYADEYRFFAEQLSNNYGITITNEQLIDTLNIYKKNHQLLNTIHLGFLCQKLSAKDYFSLLHEGYCLRKEEHNILLTDALRLLDHSDKLHSTNNTPILLVGSINGITSGWLEYFESLGIHIVNDDTCDYSREKIDISEQYVDPYQQLAYLTSLKLCPVKSIDCRFERLYEQYKKSGAKGIIFMIYQYCEAQQLDFSLLKRDLKKYSIPSLVINSATSVSKTGQIETRIEAFLEMIANYE